ncbi:MAG: lysophospholipid acyltransferase family protein, partial [Pontixanthobacter sp.]
RSNRNGRRLNDTAYRPSIAGSLRIGWRLAALLALLLVFVPLHYAYRLFRNDNRIPMLFLRYCGQVCGVEVCTIGTPLRQSVLFVSNHISWLDILCLAGASGTAFVAKHELSTTPLIGWLCDLNRTIYVKRDSRVNVGAQIEQVREALDDDWAVAIFPEGTTGDARTLLPFKTSMLSVLEPPPDNVMVQPVFLDYGATGREIAWIGDETGIENAKRILARRGTIGLTIYFLEPFSPHETRGRKAIAARARASIDAAMQTAQHG